MAYRVALLVAACLVASVAGAPATAKLKFSNGAILQELNSKEVFPASVFQERPKFQFPKQAGKFYTAAIYDTVNPQGEARNYAHFVVINLAHDGKVQDADVVVEYLPPVFAEGTHTFTLVVMEQTGQLDTATIPRIKNNMGLAGFQGRGGIDISGVPGEIIAENSWKVRADPVSIAMWKNLQSLVGEARVPEASVPEASVPAFDLKFDQKILAKDATGRSIAPVDAQVRPLMKLKDITVAGELHTVTIFADKGPAGLGRQYCHFLAVNLPAASSMKGADVLVEFFPPAPEPGQQRTYTVSVYKQESRVGIESLPKAEKNQIFGARQQYKPQMMTGTLVGRTTWTSKGDEFSASLLGQVKDAVQRAQGEDATAAQQPSQQQQAEEGMFVLAQFMGKPILMEQIAPLSTFEGPNPRVDWNAKVDKLYTVMMVQDQSTGTPETPWLHWLVVDVPDTTILAQGKTVCTYSPPEPEAGTGKHHYQILVFEQTQPSGSNKFIAEFEDPWHRGKFVPSVLADFLNSAGRGVTTFYTLFGDAPQAEVKASEEQGQKWASQQIEKFGIDMATFGQGARRQKTEL